MNGHVIIIHIEFIHIGIGHVWNIVFLDSIALCNFIVFSQQIPTQMNAKYIEPETKMSTLTDLIRKCWPDAIRLASNRIHLDFIMKCVTNLLTMREQQKNI